jgi:thiamine pyrophosphate-dependent acetolactate synthase large subunit-like protein
MMVLVGNVADSASRTAFVEPFHTATDVAAMVRGYIKHDAQPLSLQAFGEELTKAHSMSLTAPYGPVLVTVDADLAELPMEGKIVATPAYKPVHQAVADPSVLAEVAKLLVAAQRPLIVADRVANSPEAMAHLVELAELLQVPVFDQLNRANFPNNHHLYTPFTFQLLADADVILALDSTNLFSLVGAVPDLPQRETVLRVKPGTKVINISSVYSLTDGNYQDQNRFYQADMAIAGDSAASLPFLIEAVQRAITSERRSQNGAREAQLRAAFQARRQSDLQKAAIGWDVSPISVARMNIEVWEAIKNDGGAYSLVSDAVFQNNWPQRLWTMDKYHQSIGGSGAYGMGYAMPAATGAAVAARDMGIYAVNLIGDGDLLTASGSLWTAAHHKLPLLTVVHNNRAWHQEFMHLTRMADRRQRHPERASIGTVIDDPTMDFARIAQGSGVYAEGPISDPAKLAPALARAMKVVRGGRPALVDVVAQGR